MFTGTSCGGSGGLTPFFFSLARLVCTRFLTWVTARLQRIVFVSPVPAALMLAFIRFQVTMQTPFLSAEWRHLVMLNYAVNRDVLQPFVPPGTELDFFGDRTFLSVIGFRFLRTGVF